MQCSAKVWSAACTSDKRYRLGEEEYVVRRAEGAWLSTKMQLYRPWPVSKDCGLVRFLHVIVLVDTHTEKVETLRWAHIHINTQPSVYYASVELT